MRDEGVFGFWNAYISLGVAIGWGERALTQCLFKFLLANWNTLHLCLLIIIDQTMEICFGSGSIMGPIPIKGWRKSLTFHPCEFVLLLVEYCLLLFVIQVRVYSSNNGFSRRLLEGVWGDWFWGSSSRWRSARCFIKHNIIDVDW